MTTKSKTRSKKGHAAGTFLDARISGLENHPAKTVVFDGKPVLKTRLLAKLRALQRLIQRPADIEVQRSQAVRDRDAGLEANAEFLKDVDPAIRVLVGKDATALKKFGLEPLKVRGPLSAANRLIATQRLNETRTALGTRGPRQKAELLDQVRGKPQVQVVDPKARPAATGQPPREDPAPSPTPTPAPAAGPGPANEAPTGPAASPAPGAPNAAAAND